MPTEPTGDEKWLPVIGRSLAYLCLRTATEIKELSVLQKAVFLEGLGLSRADAAAVLGTTPASISELQRQARKNKGAGKNKGAKRGTTKTKSGHSR